MDADWPGECAAGSDGLLLVDTGTLANGGATRYFSVAVYADGVQSDPSNLVTIIAVNDAPTIVAIPNQTIVVNTSAGPLNFTVGDEDPASVTVAASSSNTALVPTANIVFAGTGANRTVTVTPASESNRHGNDHRDRARCGGRHGTEHVHPDGDGEAQHRHILRLSHPAHDGGHDANLGLGSVQSWQCDPAEMAAEGGGHVRQRPEDAAHHRGGPWDCVTREQRMSAEWWRSHPAARPCVRQANRQQHLPVRRDRQAVHLQLGHERRNEGQRAIV